MSWLSLLPAAANDAKRCSLSCSVGRSPNRCLPNALAGAACVPRQAPTEQAVPGMPGRSGPSTGALTCSTSSAGLPLELLTLSGGRWPTRTARPGCRLVPRRCSRAICAAGPRRHRGGAPQLPRGGRGAAAVDHAGLRAGRRHGGAEQLGGHCAADATSRSRDGTIVVGYAHYLGDEPLCPAGWRHGEVSWADGAPVLHEAQQAPVPAADGCRSVSASKPDRWPGCRRRADLHVDAGRFSLTRRRAHVSWPRLRRPFTNGLPQLANAGVPDGSDRGDGGWCGDMPRWSAGSRRTAPGAFITAVHTSTRRSPPSGAAAAARRFDGCAAGAPCSRRSRRRRDRGQRWQQPGPVAAPAAVGALSDRTVPIGAISGDARHRPRACGYCAPSHLRREGCEWMQCGHLRASESSATSSGNGCCLTTDGQVVQRGASRHSARRSRCIDGRAWVRWCSVLSPWPSCQRQQDRSAQPADPQRRGATVQLRSPCAAGDAPAMGGVARTSWRGAARRTAAVRHVADRPAGDRRRRLEAPTVLGAAVGLPIRSGLGDRGRRCLPRDRAGGGAMCGVRPAAASGIRRGRDRCVADTAGSECRTRCRGGRA